MGIYSGIKSRPSFDLTTALNNVDAAKVDSADCGRTPAPKLSLDTFSWKMSKAERETLNEGRTQNKRPEYAVFHHSDLHLIYFKAVVF